MIYYYSFFAGLPLVSPLVFLHYEEKLFARNKNCLIIVFRLYSDKKLSHNFYFPTFYEGFLLQLTPLVYFFVYNVLGNKISKTVF